MTIDLNPLALAYLGDAIYEFHIREYLLSKGICKVADLQKESIKYVSAKSQYKFLIAMIDSHLFTDEELNIIYRARNHKVDHKPKNCDIVTYKYATGLEAIIGYLYLNNDKNRIDVIMNYIKGE